MYNFELTNFIMDLKIFIIFGAIVANAMGKIAPRDPKSDLFAISRAINKFSMEFFEKSLESATGNFVCSPLSVAAVLSMAAYGARGTTELEMKSKLHLPEDDIVGQKGFKLLFETLDKIKTIDYKFLQYIFTDDYVKVNPDMSKMTSRYFQTVPQNVNFKDARKAAKIINVWCEKNTNNIIKDIVQPDDIADALLVLVNAIYFKGHWKSQFKPEDTSLKPFFVDKQTSILVPMMCDKNEYNFGLISDSNDLYVELPYETNDPNSSVSMFVMLPFEDNFETSLQEMNFKEMHDEKNIDKLELIMPKLKLTSTLDLQSTLEKMGMREMFTDRANFSAISNLPLKITKIKQKAFIEVNEEGTKAAASTAMVGKLKSAGLLRLVVNKPFHWVIVHIETNTILFAGHVRDPSY